MLVENREGPAIEILRYLDHKLSSFIFAGLVIIAIVFVHANGRGFDQFRKQLLFEDIAVLAWRLSYNEPDALVRLVSFHLVVLSQVCWSLWPASFFTSISRRKQSHSLNSSNLKHFLLNPSRSDHHLLKIIKLI